MKRTRIKFCGCRTERDVENALLAGADAIGFVFAPSRRTVAFSAARRLLELVPPEVLPVAVFIEPTQNDISRLAQMRAGIAFQVTCAEKALLSALPQRPAFIQTLRIGASTTTGDLEAALWKHEERTIIFDTDGGAGGGTGRVFPWRIVKPLIHRRRAFVAGGLTPGNVARCIRLLRPYGVDVSSGIESHGNKDLRKMRSFVEAVRAADGD